MATNTTCDRCGTVQQVRGHNIPTYYSAPGWGRLRLSMQITADSKADFPGGRVNIENDVCPSCILKMNLPVVNNVLEMPTIESMIQDIVYESLEHQ